MKNIKKLTFYMKTELSAEGIDTKTYRYYTKNTSTEIILSDGGEKTHVVQKEGKNFSF